MAAMRNLPEVDVGDGVRGFEVVPQLVQQWARERRQHPVEVVGEQRRAGGDADPVRCRRPLRQRRADDQRDPPPRAPLAVDGQLREHGIHDSSGIDDDVARPAAMSSALRRIWMIGA